MELNQVIGKNLKNARKVKGYTQAQIAEKMNILQPAYARYESGKIQLSYEQIDMLCKLLDISPNYLWDYQDE